MGRSVADEGGKDLGDMEAAPLVAQLRSVGPPPEPEWGRLIPTFPPPSLGTPEPRSCLPRLTAFSSPQSPYPQTRCVEAPMPASDRIISLSETHTSPQESGNFPPISPKIVAIFSFLLRLHSNPLGEGGEILGATLKKKWGVAALFFWGAATSAS